jgi:serine/threonine protein kinase
MPLESGSRLGRYEIRSRLGAGGMGEVYLAHDSKLERKVALKILLGQFTADAERLRRFAREARAASALNHPNIVTVYDVDVDGETPYITTEFIEGETLRARLQRGRIPLAEALTIATQVADALAAAHRAGIVHRDIKPENLVLRPDGYVKVVDFGLAKLAETTLDQDSVQTRTALETHTGILLGTVAYMSPEQARALPVDARSDVWSLGVVLYEMIAGRRPFEGATTSDVIAMILQHEPAKLGTFAAEAAGEMELVVETALAKDADERYQDARDFGNVLKRVRRHLEGDTQSTRIDVPPATTRHKSALRALLPLALVVAGIAGYRWYRDQPGDRPAEATSSFERFQIARVTSIGRVIDAAISRDGRYVVHSVDDGPGQSLWMRHVNTNSNVEIVPSAEVTYIGMTFSNDGDYVYYVSRRLSGGVASLYRIAVLGGIPSKVIDDVDTSITFSPDGTRLAYIRGYPDGSSSVVVADTEGNGQRRLATLQAPAGFAISDVEAVGPSWSPDGKTIAVPIIEPDAAGRHNPIGIVDADSGKLTRLGSLWYMVRRLAWLADNSGLLAAAADKSSAYSAQQVWHIPYPDGAPRTITRDLSNYRGVSVTASGRAFLAVQTSTTAEIWVAPGKNPDGGSVVTPSKTTFDGRFGMSWAPDGRLVYSSAANGTFDLWIMNADGTGRRPIATDAGASIYPDVFRDGKTVVMSSDQGSNAFEIWRMAIDGTDMAPLTRTDSAWAPSALPDGSILFTVGSSIWRVAREGGTPVLVTEANASRTSVSPDGNRFVCSYRQTSTARAQLAVFHVGEAAPRQVFDIPATADAQARWGPDGRSLHYIDTRGGVSNIWSLSLEGGAATQVTHFKTDRIFAFAWSRDGTRLALARGAVISDAVLITSDR